MITLGPLLLVWCGLLALLAVELIITIQSHLGPVAPCIGAVMAIVVAVAFMRAANGPAPIRLFICFGAIWLLVLLSLGLMDPLTRG